MMAQDNLPATCEPAPRCPTQHSKPQGLFSVTPTLTMIRMNLSEEAEKLVSDQQRLQDELCEPTILCS